ncbi:MATE family efflux transporter [Xanthomonas sp. WHRI 6106]|uniref:MATE family efflux transporter n=1 Tax=Xanthomonas sp. WHRI 6106 TaxID=3161566 RepID=UPI0032E8BE59
MTALDARTRLLLEAPIAPTLARLAVPNVLVMVAQASAGLIETYFVGKLGTDALAGMALVFPIVMLMQMMSSGAIGGGIASSIARALGGGRREDANAVVVHALVIAVAFGVLFTLALWAGGRWLYRQMGGTGAALDAALTYSHWIFAGAVFVWLLNSLAAVLRGSGNMAVLAKVTVYGVIGLIPLSPLLIFGWGRFLRWALPAVRWRCCCTTSSARWCWRPICVRRAACCACRLRRSACVQRSSATSCGLA